jgi:hypothetical protein
LIDAFQNPHSRINGAAGVKAPPEKIARKCTVKRSPKPAKKFFCAASGGKTEEPCGNHVKGETIEEGFKPP